MPASTPTYGLRYLELSDPPDIPALGEDLATDVEAELTRVDGELADHEARVVALEGVLVQSGRVVVEAVGTDTEAATFTFPVPFSAPPNVTMTTNLRDWYANNGSDPTTTGAEARVNQRNTGTPTATVTVHWIAVGPA